MFGAVDAGLVLDIMKQEGYYEQLPLFLTPPKFELDEKYMCSVYSGFKMTDNGTGNNYGVTSYVDHPAFTSLRNQLEKRGYIKAEHSWSNGDRVTNAFYLNNYLFEPEEQFPCASAMGNKFSIMRNAVPYNTADYPRYLPVKVPYNEDTNESV